MSVGPSRPLPDLRRTTGAYHGHETYRLDSPHVWLEALAGPGPRIVRLGVAGSDRNLLAETPDDGWDTPLGRYELFGGHRLWFAPEDPNLVAVPDSAGLRLSEHDRGVELEGAPEPTGLVRSISISLDADAPAVELRHRLANRGDKILELAPWSITQLPLDGVAILPQTPPVEEHLVRPNRLLVLWPYSSWEDERLELCDSELRVHAVGGSQLKIGTFVHAGHVSYRHDDTVLVFRFAPDRDRSHPDSGCNAEVFVGDRYVEIEVLGPLVSLAAGSTAELDVRWEIGAMPAS